MEAWWRAAVDAVGWVCVRLGLPAAKEYVAPLADHATRFAAYLWNVLEDYVRNVVADYYGAGAAEPRPNAVVQED